MNALILRGVKLFLPNLWFCSNWLSCQYNKKLCVFMNSRNCELTMIKKFTLLELSKDATQSPCYFCYCVHS